MNPTTLSLLLLSVLLVSTSDSANDPPVKRCVPGHCGNITNITYPFLVSRQQPLYCGFPQFTLYCYGDILYLNTSAGEYYVHNISYVDHSILVSPRSLNPDCPVYRNLSFSPASFIVSPTSMYLLLLYHCQGPQIPDLYQVPCTESKIFTFLLSNYTVEPIEFFEACETVEIPVFGFLGANASDYDGLVKDGFLLEWIAADCSDCTASGGQCGYNVTKTTFMCICNDRTHSRHCSQLRDGRVVAVKRLYENNYKREEQFLNEVDILSRLRHQYLVTLYGCTSRHSRELLLVYEFVANGTVADHLHGPCAPENGLTWGVRLNIAIETADALAYLHANEPQIIHRDVKTNNILLDTSFHVKVADFGLSRLFPVDATHVSTLPQGTPGYVDPEYHQCYHLTDKSDVYSFGVVLVELISSMPAVDISRHRHEINLANLAMTKIQNREIEQLVDPRLGYREDWEIEKMINMVAELAFRCLQGDRDMRPTIKEVLAELRQIENKGEKVVEVGEIRDDARLLKTEAPYSPDTVTGRWDSNTTTPNTSA